jgi:hypothetical protein
MNLPSSFISSSDAMPSSEPDIGRNRRQSAGRLLLWTVIWLLAIDLFIGAVFPYPDDPRNVTPSRIALYFDYGRSIEGRLRRSTRAEPDKTAPITLAGWYKPMKVVDFPAKPGSVKVSFYGMSHCVRLAEALQRTSSRYSARSIGAPGATTNWAYGAFRRDKDRAGSKAAVLAIMSSTLPMITTQSPMTWNTSFAMPYTADRFVVRQDGELRVVSPPYESFADYVTAFEDTGKWTEARKQFARNDPFYDPLLLHETVLDHSALVRLARRAWSQSRDRAMRHSVLDATHYDADSEAVRLANAVIADFARVARRDGLVPIVYIVNNFGYGDQLYRALQATLVRENIPYLSSHTIVDPRDPRNYLPDSHFTDANDDKLARALDAVLSDALREKRAHMLQ